jgi:hypothetical protein
MVAWKEVVFGERESDKKSNSQILYTTRRQSRSIIFHEKTTKNNKKQQNTLFLFYILHYFDKEIHYGKGIDIRSHVGITLGRCYICGSFCSIV